MLSNMECEFMIDAHRIKTIWSRMPKDSQYSISKGI